MVYEQVVERKLKLLKEYTAEDLAEAQASLMGIKRISDYIKTKGIETVETMSILLRDWLATANEIIRIGGEMPTTFETIFSGEKLLETADKMATAADILLKFLLGTPDYYRKRTYSLDEDITNCRGTINDTFSIINAIKEGKISLEKAEASLRESTLHMLHWCSLVFERFKEGFVETKSDMEIMARRLEDLVKNIYATP